MRLAVIGERRVADEDRGGSEGASEAAHVGSRGVGVHAAPDGELRGCEGQEEDWEEEEDVDAGKGQKRAHGDERLKLESERFKEQQLRARAGHAVPPATAILIMMI